MKYFEFLNSVNVICGINSLKELPKELEKYGCEKAMLISGPILTKIGAVEKIEKKFENTKVQIKCLYNKIPNDSSLEVVNDVVRVYREENCDCIIAAGGGSVLDTAKAVRLVLMHDAKDIRDYVGMEGVFDKKYNIPFVAIPTTSGTGSEVTKVAVISDIENNVKMEFINKNTLPDFCILDPSMTKTLPIRATFTTALDTLTHAIEGYTGTQSEPLTDIFALKAIKLVSENIDKVIEDPNDLDVRVKMMEASMLAGIAFSNSMVGVVHGIGHAVGGVSHVAHDQAMTILLPHCMRFNYDRLKDKYSKLLYYLVDNETYRNIKEDDRATESIRVIDNLIEKYHNKIGIYKTLSEAGVKREDLQKITITALRDGAMLANVKTVEKYDVEDILSKAF